MEAPTRNYDTSKNALVVDWVPLLGDDTGSAAILSYHV
jgi:hypothetical protein